MAETTGIISLIGQDKGLQKVLDAGGRSFDKLNDNLTTGIDSLKDYRDGLNLTEKAMGAASKTATRTGRLLGDSFKTASNAYDKVTSSAERTIDVADSLDNAFVGLAAKALKVHTPFKAVNSVLQPMAGFFSDVSDQTTAFGKAAVILNEVSQPVVGTLNTASDASESLAEKLSKMGAVGAFVGQKMLGLSASLATTANALGMADRVGDIYLLLDGMKEFAQEAGPAAIETATSLAGAYQSFGVHAILFGDAIKTTTTLSRVLSVTTKGFVQDAAKFFLKTQELRETVGVFIKLADAAGKAYLAFQNLNETFSVFESMGLDTTAAQMAVEIANMGTSLLTSGEAAQRFANITISAFAKLQDQLAFVQTLSAGASVGMEELSTTMIDLVNGPLQNSIRSTEAAASLYNALSAGVGVAADGTAKLGEATGFLEAGLKLAAGTGTDASQSMEVLAKVSSAYSLSNRNAAETAAKLNAVVETGIVTFPQLTGGLARVAGVAKSSGVALDEFLGSISALTITMTADDAMTGYASLLSSIAGQGKQAQDAVQQLGIRFDSQRVKSDGLIASLNDLYRATGGSTQKLKEIIPDQLAYTTALTLMTSANKNATKFAEQVGETGGESLDKLFGQRQQSLIKEATALMNGFQEIMVDFGQRVLPLLEPGIKFLQGVLETLQELPEPVKQFIGTIVLTNLAINRSIGVFQSFAGTLSGLAIQYLATRTLSMAVRGTLLQEVGAVKELILVRKDFAGALLQIFGIEQNAVKQTKQQIALQESQAKSQQVLNELFGTSKKELQDNVTAYEGALSKIKEMKERTRDLSKEDLSAAGLPSRQSLTRAEKEVTRTIDLLSQSQNQSLKEMALQSGQALIQEVPQQIEQGKTKVDEAFEKLFAGASIASAKIDSLRFKAADSIKALFEDTTKTTRERSETLKSAFSEVFGQMGQSVEEKKPEILEQIVKLLEESESTLEEKKEAFSEKIKELFASEGEEGEDTANQISEYVNKIIEATQSQTSGDEKAAEAKKELTTTTTAATAATAVNTKANQANAASQGFLGKTTEFLTKQRALGNQQTIADMVLSTRRTLLAKAEAVQLKMLAAAQAAFSKSQLVSSVQNHAFTRALVDQSSALISSIGATKAATVASKALGGVKMFAAGAAGVLGGALKIAAAGMKVFWASLGPIGLAIGALTAGFMMLQDVLPFLGGAAGEAKKVAEGLDAITASSDKAKAQFSDLEEEGRKYTGFINSQLLPATNFLVKTLMFPSRLMMAPFVSLEESGKIIDDTFTAAKDKVQDFIDAPMWEALERTDVALQDTFDRTLNNATELKAGEFISKVAKQKADLAKAQKRALTGEELKEALAADTEALQGNIKANEEMIAKLEEQKNAASSKELQDALQSRIDQLKDMTTVMEENSKAQQRFIQDLNTTAEAIEANNAAKGADKVRDNLKRQAEQALSEVPEALRGQYKQIFDQLDENMNLASNTQRRQAVQLVTATRNFIDNVGKASNIKSLDGLEKLRQDADSFLENIDTSEAAGTISKDFADQLRRSILEQEVEIPQLNMKGGSILSGSQIDQVNQAINNSEIQLAEMQVRTYTNTINRIKTLQAQRVMSEEQAGIEIQKNEVKTADEQIRAELRVLQNVIDNQGKESQAYKDQIFKIQQMQQDAAQKRAALDEQLYQQQMRRRQRQAENEAAVVAQTYRRYSNTLEFQNRELEQQRNLMQSYQSLANATLSLEAARLQNQQKLTTDSVRRAEIDTQLAEKRLQTLVQSQAQERESAKIQAQMNVMAAQQQIIQNAIAQAENKRAISLAKIELINAQREKRPAEELEAIRLQISELEMTGNQLQQNGKQLADNRQQQIQMNKNAEFELSLRQQQAREEGKIELQLARQQQIIALLDRQKKTLELNASVEENRLQNQLKLTSDIGKQAALEEQLAEQRLLRLDEQQKLEQNMLAARNPSEYEKRELAISQAIARENAQVELRLAREKTVSAELEQQSQIRIQAIELVGQRENQIFDAISKAADLQSRAMEARKQGMEAIKTYVEGEAQILLETARNSRERKKVAEQLARFQLNNLLRTQAIERQNLEMQIKQQQMALERQKIELQTARIKNQAETQMAAAEAERVKARYEQGLASERELQAAQMAVAAKVSEGAGMAFSELLLQQQSQMEAFSAQQQRRGLAMTQDLAGDQARLNLANNMRNRGRGRQLRRAIAADARDALFQDNGFGSFSMAQAPAMNLPDARAFMEAYQAGIMSGAMPAPQMRPAAPIELSQKSGQYPQFGSSPTAGQPPAAGQTAMQQTNGGITIERIEFNMTFEGSAQDKQNEANQARQGVQEGLRLILEEAARRRT